MTPRKVSFSNSEIWPPLQLPILLVLENPQSLGLWPDIWVLWNWRKKQTDLPSQSTVHRALADRNILSNIKTTDPRDLSEERGNQVRSLLKWFISSQGERHQSCSWYTRVWLGSPIYYTNILVYRLLFCCLQKEFILALWFLKDRSPPWPGSKPASSRNGGRSKKLRDYIFNLKNEGEGHWKWGGEGLNSCPLLPPVRLYLLHLHRQCYPQGTKCLRAQDFRGHFSFKPPQTGFVFFRFFAFIHWFVHSLQVLRTEPSNLHMVDQCSTVDLYFEALLLFIYCFLEDYGQNRWGLLKSCQAESQLYLHYILRRNELYWHKELSLSLKVHSSSIPNSPKLEITNIPGTGGQTTTCGISIQSNTI